MREFNSCQQSGVVLCHLFYPLSFGYRVITCIGIVLQIHLLFVTHHSIASQRAYH